MINEKNKTVAIMGGTFDPIHLGHLIIAEQAINNFELDQVLFMPAGTPPHKDLTEVSKGEHRLKMVKKAIKGNPKFALSEYEYRKDEKAYTADTLRYFQRKEEASELYFIIGADSLFDIFNWKEPEFLLSEGNFIVAGRPGYSLEKALKNEQFISYRDNINLLDHFQIEISSSWIRKLCKEDNSIKYLTPEPVRKYINQHELYRA